VAGTLETSPNIFLMKGLPVRSIFWFIVVYVISFLLWWTFEHLRSNESIFHLQVEKQQLIWKIGEQGNHPTLLKNQLEILQQIEEKRFRRMVMFITEGCVFLGILLWGIYQLANSLMQSIAFKRRQNNFLLSITHEFKTPLAGIQLLNQTLMRRELTVDTQRELLQKSNNEVSRLSQLIDKVLEAARLGSGVEMQREKILLSTLLAELLEDFEPRLEELGFELEKNIQPGIFIMGNEMAVRSIVGNLIDNAIKYGINGKWIQVSLSCSGDVVLISVADQGIGIEEEEKTKLFDVFYRVGSEETRSTQGTGLGLYIVHRSVIFLNGAISIRNNSPVGTIFDVRIPKA
jgi:signal transduction histidine kinase